MGEVSQNVRPVLNWKLQKNFSETNSLTDHDLIALPFGKTYFGNNSSGQKLFIQSLDNENITSFVDLPLNNSSISLDLHHQWTIQSIFLVTKFETSGAALWRWTDAQGTIYRLSLFPKEASTNCGHDFLRVSIGNDFSKDYCPTANFSGSRDFKVMLSFDGSWLTLDLDSVKTRWRIAPSLLAKSQENIKGKFFRIGASINKNDNDSYLQLWNGNVSDVAFFNEILSTFYSTNTDNSVKIANNNDLQTRSNISTIQKVLSVGPTGTWDSIYVAEPRIILVGGTLVMYYYGVGNSFNNLTQAVGAATSTDSGKTWIKVANPIFTTDNLQNHIADGESPGYKWPTKAYVIQKNGRFYMFYRAELQRPENAPITCIDSSGKTLSTAKPGFYSVIGMAESDDPIRNWKDTGIILRPELCTDMNKIDTPAAIMETDSQGKNRITLWYSAGMGSRREPNSWQMATGKQETTSKWVWQKYGSINSQNVFVPQDIAVPNVNNYYLAGGLGGMSIYKSNGIYYNFFNAFSVYNGDPGNEKRSGFSSAFMTTSTDGIHWNLPDTLVPLLPRGADIGQPDRFDALDTYRVSYVKLGNKCSLYYNGKYYIDREEIGRADLVNCLW